ncbi:hypothetical protein KF913_20585 [Candidatus Obscuribacterales bacterium]|jgi:Flp pilus assembly protein TadG|nr:hypothetical protein [Candidatus Obscuribacterales bacterium]
MYMTRNRRNRRNTIGGALIETVVGLFILIPVVLFLVDVVAMVLAQMSHDALAKDCARAAAEVDETRFPGKTQTDINGVIARFNNPLLHVDSNSWSNPSPGVVRVETRSTFTFPVYIPFVGAASQQFVAEASEPLVGVLSP